MHLTLLQQAHAGDPCSLAGAALKRKLPNAGSLLRTGVQQHCAPLIYLNQNPDFARLQKDPHFADLAHDLDLPEP
jgi:hypothetical protein